MLDGEKESIASIQFLFKVFLSTFVSVSDSVFNENFSFFSIETCRSYPQANFRTITIAITIQVVESKVNNKSI